MSSSLQMLRSFSSRRISLASDAKNCQLDLCSNARAVKDFTAIGVSALLKKERPHQQLLNQRKRDEKRETEPLQLPRKKERILNQKTKRMPQRTQKTKLLCLKPPSKKRKRKLQKSNKKLFQNAATRSANPEP